MWNFILKKVGLLLSLIVFTTCQPMYHNQLESSTEGVFSVGTDQDSAKIIPSRSGEKEFKETFVSDKLDLVFVLDTSPQMEVFYQTDLFGKTFLDRFQKYDWRFAYTDMSVDISKISQQEESQSSKKEKSDCSFLYGLSLALGGLAYAQPGVSAIGLSNLFDCVSEMDLTKKKSDFTNGKFLPLEYEGEMWNKGEKTFLTNSVQNYNEIFHHTVKLGSGGKRADYDSPLQKESKAYPFLSMILSMAKSDGLQSTDPVGSTNFFRKDSKIVYVLFTVDDLHTQIDPEYFKNSVHSFFGSKNRLKIIPVTVKSNFSLICQIRFKMTPSSERTSKLEKFVTKFDGSSVLNICSSDLADDLFTEISNTLYPTGFLND